MNSRQNDQAWRWLRSAFSVGSVVAATTSWATSGPQEGARSASGEGRRQLEFTVVDPDFPTAELAAAGYHQSTGPDASPDGLPTPAERENVVALLEREGQIEKAKSWDLLETDLFIARARRERLAQLARRYSQFPRSTLAKVQAFLHRAGKKK